MKTLREIAWQSTSESTPTWGGRIMLCCCVRRTSRRQFYFDQAAGQRWSTRELIRPMDAALYERVALSRDSAKLIAIEKKGPKRELIRYEDAFKDPYLLNFLGLKEAYSEKDLEAAIIQNLQKFLSELGSDFCFVGRQYPMRVDDRDYFLVVLRQVESSGWKRVWHQGQRPLRWMRVTWSERRTCGRVGGGRLFLRGGAIEFVPGVGRRTPP